MHLCTWSVVPSSWSRVTLEWRSMHWPDPARLKHASSVFVLGPSCVTPRSCLPSLPPTLISASLYSESSACVTCVARVCTDALVCACTIVCVTFAPFSSATSHTPLAQYAPSSDPPAAANSSTMDTDAPAPTCTATRGADDDISPSFEADDVDSWTTWIGAPTAAPAGTLMTTASEAVAALMCAKTPPRMDATAPMTSEDAPCEIVETVTPSVAPETLDLSGLYTPSTRTTRVASAAERVHAAASTASPAAASAATGLVVTSAARSVNL
mmetsp:Transcript_6981/g.31545  ORF Transcript_6981/g.31545 Transcript_6981/m.31545 type:complete len:269 (+) Transcript_6981:429-1235(+)